MMHCLTQFCCICLDKKDDLQNMRHNQINSCYNKLIICIPQLEFDSDDSSICLDCVNQIDQIYNFRELCLKNNELLKNYILQQNKTNENYNNSDTEKIYIKDEPIDIEFNDEKSCKIERVETNSLETQRNNLLMNLQVSNDKLTRNTITLETKIQILDRLQQGERVMKIAKSYELNESTIRSIKKNENKIRNSVSLKSDVYRNSIRYRTPIIEKMETNLRVWIEDCHRAEIQLNHKLIRQKALDIYKNLKENGEPSVKPDFVASNGWLERFKKRFSLTKITKKKNIKNDLA